MRLERVTSAAHPMYTQAMALYKKSFPPYEQREAPSQECILGEEDYNFALVYDGKLFVGLVLYWEAAEYLYIEHFTFCRLCETIVMGGGRWICWRNSAKL